MRPPASVKLRKGEIAGSRLLAANTAMRFELTVEPTRGDDRIIRAFASPFIPAPSATSRSAAFRISSTCSFTAIPCAVAFTAANWAEPVPESQNGI